MYSQDWLDEPTSIRGIFVEAHADIDGVDTTIYFSSIGYLTATADVHFLPLILGNITYTEEISLSNSISMTFGDIELANRNGEMDYLLSTAFPEYVWVNKVINVYYGDPRWVTTDITNFKTVFRQVFSGLIADIDSRNIGSINIRIKDKLDLLNTAVSSRLVGPGGSIEAEEAAIIPLVFGEVFNISPTLYNTPTIQYIYSDKACESIIEIRDNGVPIYTRDSLTVLGATPNTLIISGSTVSGFVLLSPLVGTPTVSIQGSVGTINLVTGEYTNTYTNTVVNTILLLATHFGANPITTSSLDLINLNSFNTDNTVPVGIFIPANANVLDLCNQLAASVGASIYFNRLGKLQLLKIGRNYSNAGTTNINTMHMLAHSFGISNKPPIIASSRIGYCKNWTTQSGLTTYIPDVDKEDFSIEFLYASYSDTPSTIKYSISSEVVTPTDTLLIRKEDALAEATRIVEYYKTPRIVYKFTGISSLLSLELGQAVILIHPRFGLSNGKSGQVISLSPNWTTNTIEVEVII